MEKKRKEEYASTLWQIRYKQMWQARMENNSADTDGRCSSGQDTRIYIYASCAREYESKQRTTAVTGALQSFAFGPGEGQGWILEKNFFDASWPQNFSHRKRYQIIRRTVTRVTRELPPLRGEKGKKRGKKRREN